MPLPRRLLKKLPEIVDQEVARQAPERPIRLMFQDEARFGRINDPRRCWAPKGCRPEVGMQIVREYTYAFGAASPHDGVLDTLVLPVVTAETMSIFLAEVARRHPEEFILMFLDGAGWHRANNLVIPENMKLEALPPYSPQLNPMEHIWDEVREKWFTNEVFESLDGVEDRLVEALAALENDQELVASTTGFDWIINCPFSATQHYSTLPSVPTSR
jgi:transposase